MADARVVLTGKTGGAEIVFGSARTITLVKPGHDGFDGYDETRNLKVSAHVLVVSGATSTNGSGHGDLVLVFDEPAASAGREPATGAVAAAGEQVVAPADGVGRGISVEVFAHKHTTTYF